VPPREPSRTLDDEVIPVLPGVLLTTDDISTALTAQGAENVVVIPLKPKLDSISEFVVATGRSTRHLRKMSDSIVTALKSRNLRQALGYKGAEGEKDDDWLLIDCHNVVVHLMLPGTRKAIDLEAHWSTDQNARPSVTFSHNEDAYEKSFESLLEQYPVPDNYNASADSYGVVKEEQNVPLGGRDRERERGVQSNSNKKLLPQHIRRL
jgi:ribosome-associated protein